MTFEKIILTYKKNMILFLLIIGIMLILTFTTLKDQNLIIKLIINLFSFGWLALKEVIDEYKIKKFNKDWNTKIIDRIYNALVFIGNIKKIEATDDYPLSLEDCIEKIFEKNLIKADEPFNNALIFICLLNIYINAKPHDLNNEPTLKDLKNFIITRLNKYSFQKTTRNERVMANVYNLRNEKNKLENLNNELGFKNTLKILFEIARLLNAKQMYDFFQKEINKKAELNSVLREIIQEKIDKKIFRDAGTFDKVKGAFLIIGKNIPKDIEKNYLPKLPIIVLGNRIFASNIPQIGTKSIALYLVKPKNNRLSAIEFSEILRKKIINSKDHDRKTKTELYVINIKTDDIFRFNMKDVPNDQDYYNFRQLIYFFFGAKEAIFIEGINNQPLENLWKTSISYAEIIQELPPKVLCKSAKKLHFDLLDEISSKLDNEFQIKSLLDWKNKKSKDIFSYLNSQIITLNKIKKWKLRFTRAWKNDVQKEIELKRIANEIVKNSKRYSEAVFFRD